MTAFARLEEKSRSNNLQEIYINGLPEHRTTSTNIKIITKVVGVVVASRVFTQSRKKSSAVSRCSSSGCHGHREDQ